VSATVAIVEEELQHMKVWHDNRRLTALGNGEYTHAAHGDRLMP